LSEQKIKHDLNLEHPGFTNTFGFDKPIMKLKRKDTSQIDRISTIGVIDKLDEEDIKQPIFHMTATFGDDFDTKNHRNSVITDNMP